MIFKTNVGVDLNCMYVFIYIVHVILWNKLYLDAKRHLQLYIHMLAPTHTNIFFINNHTYWVSSMYLAQCWRIKQEQGSTSLEKLTHQLPFALKPYRSQFSESDSWRDYGVCPLHRHFQSTLPLPVERWLQITSVAITIMECWRWKIWLEKENGVGILGFLETNISYTY
jgi:hypothetical protein